MSRRPWLNRQVFGWAMFDFANQAFTLVIITTMYQLYFINHVVVENESLGRQLWATSNIIGQVIILIISPIVGALADFSGAKKRLLLVTYIACVVCTAMLGLVTPGAVALGMILSVIGFLFFSTGENFMAAFLPELAASRDMGKVSAFGFTLGYTGGLLCLAGAVVVSKIWPGVLGYRLICVWAAVFFFISALPTFLLLKEKKQREPMPEGLTWLTVGFTRVSATFHSLRRHRELFRFFIILMVYLAGMKIVIIFGGTMATKIFALTTTELGIYITISTVSAIVGAIATGLYQDRLGTRNTILFALVLWTCIMISTVFIEQDAKALFWIVGGAVGFGMGMLGTATRSLVGLFSPQHKSAEFFGFYALAHMASAIIGLTANIAAERIFPNNYNLVIASSGVFFVAGIVLTLTVDERAGRVAAMRATRQYERDMKKLATPEG